MLHNKHFLKGSLKMKKFKTKSCAECDAKFTPHSSQSKYCPECSAVVRRRLTADRVRRWRERTRENEEN